MPISIIKFLLAGTVVAGLAASSAHADPMAATVSLTNGNFQLTQAAHNVTGLTSTYLETVTGSYAVTDTIPSLTTPYDFTLGGSITVDGNTLISGTSPVFSGSIDSLGSQLLANPTYGGLIQYIAADLLNNNSGTISVGGISVAFAYSGGPSGTFELGSNYSLAGVLPDPTDDIFSANAALTVVPEPGSLALLGTGLLALGLLVSKRPKRG